VFQGEWGRFTDALIGVGAVGAYSFVMSFVLLKAINAISPIRVSEDEEDLGLDPTQHGERAYTLDEAGMAVSSVAADGIPGLMPAPAAHAIR
jgi:Amt family ammonium transporter